MACWVYCWLLWIGGVLSTEFDHWLTSLIMLTMVFVLVSSHCICYYNRMDKLSMVNWMIG
jgi:hypothetical protein